MSVDPRPQQFLLSRSLFLQAVGQTKKPADPTVPDPWYETDGASNTEEMSGKNNMMMCVTSGNDFGGIGLGLEFKTTNQYGGTSYGDNPVPTDTGVGASIIAAAVNTSDSSGNGTSSYTTSFWVKVAQDANDNQFQDGLGVTFENDLFEQTFTATYSNSFPEYWDWTPGTGSTTPVTISVTAPTVDWSLYPDYLAEIKLGTEHGPVVMWEGSFNWVFRTGWFDPSTPYWYPDNATVTIRQLIGSGGTAPTYNSPQDYLDLVTSSLPQTAFKPTAISPTPVAYS